MKLSSITFLAALLAFVHVHAQDFALKQLERSPRHHEWVSIPSGERELRAFVAYPEVADKAVTVLLIHENRGLTDWERSVADQLAAEGFIAMAPDLLSDFEPGIKTTQDFDTSDQARDGIYKLDPDQVTADLNAAFEYLQKLPAGNGTVAVAGFCWGGSQSFRYATNNPDLAMALVFYGTGPQETADYARIEAPVYGFYGENDQRVNATIQASEDAMKANGKVFEYEIYEGAGHAYMRSGDSPDGSPANKAARDASMARMKKMLAQ